MIILYSGSGAAGFATFGDHLAGGQLRALVENVKQLLIARGKRRASQLLTSIDFRLVDGLNNFGDEFLVLFSLVPLDKYEDIRRNLTQPPSVDGYRDIAEIFRELGYFIRFIAVELAVSAMSDGEISETALADREVNKLVYRWIGVSGGYLGDFSYGTHRDFYLDLDLDINPDDIDGTTRERFIRILKTSATPVQAKILQGVLQKYLPGSSELRTTERYQEIQSWIDRLIGGQLVKAPVLAVTSETVSRALSDVEQSLKGGGAVSAVDRIHTALHAYIRGICQDAGIEVERDSGLTDVFKTLKTEHPAFANLGPRSEETYRIFRAMATIVDSLGTHRNRTTLAHPNEELLKEPEAMLAVNSARTILHYLNSRLRTESKQNA